MNSSTSNFKTFLRYIVLPFFLLSLVAGGLINYFFEQQILLTNQTSGVYKINRILHETHPHEIPFFGSSRAEGTFIPDSLVAEGFNYGISATRDDVLLFFLKEECKKAKKTTPLVINLDLDGLNKDLGDVSNYIYNSDEALVRQLLDTQYKLLYTFPLLKYYGYFEHYTKNYLNNKIQLTKYTNKGASVEKGTLTKQKFEELVSQRRHEHNYFHNDPVLQEQLKDLIQSYPHRTFIFVVVPYHSSFFDGFINASESNTFLADLACHKNAKVLNFSRSDYPDDYFFNTTHLNLKGASAFNKDLKRALSPLIP